MNIAGPYWQNDPQDLRQAAKLLAMRSRWAARLGRKPGRP
jgi:hypothetical protein